MLRSFAFDRIGVVVGDLYFVDPDPDPGQEGAERGVRLEVRFFEPRPQDGSSIYASEPIVVGRPIWRADLLEAVAGPPGSLDRAHHHPHFDGWEPRHRTFDAALSAAPLEWLGGHLSDLDRILDDAGLDASAVGPGDAAALRAAVPEIVGVVERLLEGIRAGELARAPMEPTDSARVGWL